MGDRLTDDKGARPIPRIAEEQQGRMIYKGEVGVEGRRLDLISIGVDLGWASQIHAPFEEKRRIDPAG